MRRGFAFIALGLWLAAAVGIGYSGVYRTVSPVAVGATIWSLVGVSLLASFFLPAAREWVWTEPVTTFVLFHLTRFVGIWFLFLYQAGKLPYEFAVLGGWGDIIAVSWAIVVVVVLFITRERAGKGLLLAWNVFGLADILFVVVTAFRLGQADPDQMLPLREFPLNLLPLFVVPLIIATHLIIFVRLRRGTV